MYVWEYVIVEYICILNLSIRTPGRPTRRVYSSVPLTLFCVVACTGEAYYGVCIHVQSYPIKSMCAASSCQTLTSVIVYLPQSGVFLFGSLSGASSPISCSPHSQPFLSLFRGFRGTTNSLSLSSTLQSVFSIPSLAEELLYDSIVEHVASALHVFYRSYVR